MQSATRAFICNSGSEANEAAIKFARKVGKVRQADGSKNELVSFEGSFHGRTMGALSATPNPKYQKPFGPMVPGCKYGKFNDLAGIESLITEKTCGVIVEPIQGEGGINVATAAFLQKLRDRCDEVGAVLIYDEIQCGLSRTGHLWAHQALLPSVSPDILTTAKALGNGFPIGATITSEDVAACMATGDHGTTFGGNPLACRLAHYVFTRLSDGAMQQGIKAKEQLFRQGFQRLAARFPGTITEIRGRGLMLGVQLTRDPTPMITAARERGLLVITAGTNTLRFVPPLIISESEIAEGLEILEQAFQAVLEADARPDVSIEGTKGQQEMAPPGR